MIHKVVQIFSQGRVNQELGREGILPFSKFWASSKPFNAPLSGLGLRTLSSVAFTTILTNQTS